jgi:hypothetical protein
VLSFTKDSGTKGFGYDLANDEAILDDDQSLAVVRLAENRFPRFIECTRIKTHRVNQP